VTGREKVPNTALSGDELKVVLRADFNRMIENDGMLSAHAAFGRVSYELRLVLHLDNMLLPESRTSIASRKQAQNDLSRLPGLAALDTHPLPAPSDDSLVAATELHREIDSPNAERLREGIAVPVIVRQQDSTTTTEMVKYPKSDEHEGTVVITDVSQQAAQELGVKPRAPYVYPLSDSATATMQSPDEVDDPLAALSDEELAQIEEAP
jgi:hypothetical protein